MWIIAGRGFYWLDSIGKWLLVQAFSRTTLLSLCWSNAADLILEPTNLVLLMPMLWTQYPGSRPWVLQQAVFPSSMLCWFPALINLILIVYVFTTCRMTEEKPFPMPFSTTLWWCSCCHFVYSTTSDKWVFTSDIVPLPADLGTIMLPKLSLTGSRLLGLVRLGRDSLFFYSNSVWWNSHDLLLQFRNNTCQKKKSGQTV